VRRNGFSNVVEDAGGEKLITVYHSGVIRNHGLIPKGHEMGRGNVFFPAFLVTLKDG